MVSIVGTISINIIFKDYTSVELSDKEKLSINRPYNLLNLFLKYLIYGGEKLYGYS